MPGLEATLNIHPLFVHFPIALTLAAIPLIFYSFFTGKSGAMDTAATMIYMAAIAAILTLLTGNMAADSLGHDSPAHDLVHNHKYFMYWYTGLISILAMLNYFIRRADAPAWVSHWSTKAVRMVLLFSSATILIIGTDRGGLLVFGHGMGMTRQLENRSIEGADNMQLDEEHKAEQDDHADHNH